MLRQKSEVEQRRFRSYFKNLNINGVVVTGEASSVYNCVSWSVGLKDRWLWPGDNITHFDSFYQAFGLERATSGTVAIWGRSEKEIAHASVLPAGSEARWESKCGVDLRIQHSLNELSGKAYGKPIAYYSPVKPPEAADGIATGPLEFSKDEQSAIKEQVGQLPKKTVLDFEKQFEAWRNTWFAGFHAIDSNPNSRAASYEFFKLVKMKATILPLVVQKLMEKDNFLALLLYERLQQDRDLILPCLAKSEGEQGRAYRTVKAYLQNCGMK